MKEWYNGIEITRQIKAPWDACPVSPDWTGYASWKIGGVHHSVYLTAADKGECEEKLDAGIVDSMSRLPGKP